MKPSLAAQLVATELLKNKAKVVIISGSVAKGKENPNDLDIGAIFDTRNPFSDEEYKASVITKLKKEVGYELDIVSFCEDYVLDLIDYYNKDPCELCNWLEMLCIGEEYDVKDQINGWPLVWIFGEDAKKMLGPYMNYQEKFIVLEGQMYLDELRNRINVSV